MTITVMAPAAATTMRLPWRQPQRRRSREAITLHRPVVTPPARQPILAMQATTTATAMTMRMAMQTPRGMSTITITITVTVIIMVMIMVTITAMMADAATTTDRAGTTMRRR